MADMCDLCGGRATTERLSRVRWCIDCREVLPSRPAPTQGVVVKTFARPADPLAPEPVVVPRDFLPGKNALDSALAPSLGLAAPVQGTTQHSDVLTQSASQWQPSPIGTPPNPWQGD